MDVNILGLKVEVDRLVEELAMVHSRAELFASAHVATVTAHGEERAGLLAQVLQKGQLLGVSKRDLKALSIELDACKLTCTALRGAALVNKEEVRITDKYVQYLEQGNSMTAPAGGIPLVAPPRFSVSAWLALGALRQTTNLMSKHFLIPEGVKVRPFIAWIS